MLVVVNRHGFFEHHSANFFAGESRVGVAGERDEEFTFYRSGVFELAGFIGEFGFSTGDGKPGIAAALHDPSAAAEAIPLGCVLVRTDCAVDIQGLAALPQSDRFPSGGTAALRIFL